VVVAAQALLEERGYAATTVAEVARRAGLLVHQRGWTREAYAGWLARTLVASLVEPGFSRS
jgi:hypothetical protein